VNLAFSLHSPFKKQRSELMPINQTYPLHKVMDGWMRTLQIPKALVPGLYYAGRNK
jgi:adenine C2-methylase RlmN of 23S rRNA A2503 and tRNA A37